MQNALSQTTLTVATHEDATPLVVLIEKFARQNLLLEQTLSEINQNIDNFIIGRDDRTKKIIGCVSLYPYTSHLGEIRSLCVEPDYQGRGIARQLVLAGLNLAREAGMQEVISFTTQAKSFFEKIGFQHILRREVPEKVMKDCQRCVCYGNCPAQLYLFKL